MHSTCCNYYFNEPDHRNTASQWCTNILHSHRTQHPVHYPYNQFGSPQDSVVISWAVRHSYYARSHLWAFCDTFGSLAYMSGYCANQASIWFQDISGSKHAETTFLGRWNGTSRIVRDLVLGMRKVVGNYMDQWVPYMPKSYPEVPTCL